MMTTPAPQYDPNTFRRDSAPSDTQAIYIQEGGESHDSLFNSPSKHPKIFRLQEIMIVSALLCFLHGVISAFAPNNFKPLEGLPEFGVWGGLVLLAVAAVVYLWVYFTIQKGKRIGHCNLRLLGFWRIYKHSYRSATRCKCYSYIKRSCR